MVLLLSLKSYFVLICMHICSNSIVLVGRDTRVHSAELSHCVERGVSCIGGRFIDL